MIPISLNGSAILFLNGRTSSSWQEIQSHCLKTLWWNKILSGDVARLLLECRDLALVWPTVNIHSQNRALHVWDSNFSAIRIQDLLMTQCSQPLSGSVRKTKPKPNTVKMHAVFHWSLSSQKLPEHSNKRPQLGEGHFTWEHPLTYCTAARPRYLFTVFHTRSI